MLFSFLCSGKRGREDSERNHSTKASFLWYSGPGSNPGYYMAKQSTVHVSYLSSPVLRLGALREIHQMEKGHLLIKPAVAEISQ